MKSARTERLLLEPCQARPGKSRDGNETRALRPPGDLPPIRSRLKPGLGAHGVRLKLGLGVHTLHTPD